MTEFAIKDSGERKQFESGMMRDTSEGKTNYLSVRFGPMLRRWAEHLTKGRAKYPDPEPGRPNWTLADGIEEYLRAKESAARHFEQWLAGDRDEDHAAAVFFNINLAEYVLARSAYLDPATGAGEPPVFEDAPLNIPLTDEPASKPWRVVERPWVEVMGFKVGDVVLARTDAALFNGIGTIVARHDGPLGGWNVQLDGGSVWRYSEHELEKLGTEVVVGFA